MSENVEILIVDDEQTISAAIAMLLRASGYKVHIAHSTEIATAIIRTSKPCLLLLDVNMPSVNGFDFAAQIQNDDELRTSFIFVSAMTRKEHIEKGLALGAKAYISKPINPVELLSEVQKHCGSHRL